MKYHDQIIVFDPRIMELILRGYRKYKVLVGDRMARYSLLFGTANQDYYLPDPAILGKYLCFTWRGT